MQATPNGAGRLSDLFLALQRRCLVPSWTQLRSSTTAWFPVLLPLPQRTVDMLNSFQVVFFAVQLEAFNFKHTCTNSCRRVLNTGIH